MKTVTSVAPTAMAYALLTALFTGLLVLTAGCRTTTSMIPGYNPGPPAPEILAPTSTAEQVIAAVNQNTARVRSYVTNNASISVLGLPNLPLLTGNIAYEQPQRFRFTARALTGPEVDFGSNDERLWLWARQMKGPDGRSPLYTVRHDQYASSGAQNMLPVEPRWIIESLGLVTINPGTAQPPLPRPDGKLEVRTVEVSPRGQLTRVFVIDPHGWVTEQSIVDPQGTLLASATAEQFRYDPQTQVSLPEVVTVRVPAAELGLRINVGAAVVNAATGDPNQVFQPPVMQNHPVVDLGGLQQPGSSPTAQGVTPTGWQAPGATPATALTAPLEPPPTDLSALGPPAPLAVPSAPASAPTMPPTTPLVAPAQPSVYQVPPTGVPF